MLQIVYLETQDCEQYFAEEPFFTLSNKIEIWKEKKKEGEGKEGVGEPTENL